MCVPEIQTIESGRGSQIHTKRLTRRKSFSCESSETKNTHHLLSLFTAKCVSLSASSTFSFSFLLTLGSLVGTFLPLVPPLLVQFPTILVTAALAGKVPLCPPFQLTHRMTSWLFATLQMIQVEVRGQTSIKQLNSSADPPKVKFL